MVYREKKVIWILTPFILIAVIIILLMKHCEREEECLDCNELQEKIDNIKQKIKMARYVDKLLKQKNRQYAKEQIET